jgi:serine kinase of HPr protein (carbohydrate metabolism regulator)
MTGETIHASAVVVGDRGVLVRGASGAGKSSLALALVAAFGARAVLVADDRVALSAAGGRLVATAPAAIAGAMEVRGLGIIAAPHLSPAVIDLVVDLVPLAD